jgi:predicted DNA-binding transcriptional regulator AlpA
MTNDQMSNKEKTTATPTETKQDAFFSGQHFMTVKQVSYRLGMTTSAVRKLSKEGTLPAPFKNKKGKILNWFESDITQWIKSLQA